MMCLETDVQTYGKWRNVVPLGLTGSSAWRRLGLTVLSGQVQCSTPHLSTSFSGIDPLSTPMGWGRPTSCDWDVRNDSSDVISCTFCFFA
jgi:hypothetical protein